MANWKQHFDQELKRAPVTEDYTNFTATELSFRREIAKFIWDDMVNNDEKLNPDLASRALYEKFPPWAFFTDYYQGIWRVYGIKNETKMRAVTLGINNESVLTATVDMSSLHIVNSWTDSQKEKIRGSDAAGWFSDPLGMMFIITNFCCKKKEIKEPI